MQVPWISAPSGESPLQADAKPFPGGLPASVLLGLAGLQHPAGWAPTPAGLNLDRQVFLCKKGLLPSEITFILDI